MAYPFTVPDVAGEVTETMERQRPRKRLRATSLELREGLAVRASRSIEGLVNILAGLAGEERRAR